MSDELVASLLETALEARARGEEVDLDEICAGHPELIPEVERLLRIDEVLDHEAPDDALVGRVLDDRYELRQCIGVGAMGAVYLASDRTLGREVAVKLLQNAVFASPERHERFAREAKVLAALRHPNIVSVFDHGRTGDGLHYIVMERLVGMPLSEVLQQAEGDGRLRNRRLDDAWLQQQLDADVRGLGYLPQVVLWCAQVGEALREAHAAGVTHRDVKPTNVFLDEAGAAILLDFGIAARAGDGALTAQGSTIGSPWYMAPEQVEARGPVSERVDVYGLCATLYHLATLRPPFEGDYAAVLAQLTTREPVPPRFVRPELSQDLCAVIEKGMERDPARRYASMAELCDDLRALVEQLPVKARPISRFGRWLRSVRRRPAPYVAAAALVLAVGVTVPVVGSYRDGVEAHQREQQQRYLQLVAGLDPAIAFEGSFELRPRLDANQRQAYVDRLSAALELRPDDLFVRLLRSSLLLDRGEHDASLADIRTIATGHGSAFLDAFVSRYEQIDRSRPGVLGLRLDDLPPVATEVDRVVFAFQLCRRKQFPSAFEVLRDATGVTARQLRLMPLLRIGATAFLAQKQRDQLDHLLVELDTLDEQVGIATARSLYYRGCVLQVLKEWTEAAAAFERSARLAPDAYQTNYNLGVVLARLGRRQEALERTDRARRVRPDNVGAAQQFAVLLAELGRFDEADDAALSLPASGHTAEPWHRDFFVGYVRHLHCLHRYASGDAAAARTLRDEALQLYARARQRCDARPDVRRILDKNTAWLGFLDDEPAERCERLLEQLQKTPDSHLYVSALATAVEQSDFADDGLRKLMASFLRERARRLLEDESK
ncbi:MAG: protein kinase domain-containing protein [Planctomycetota bacterium]